MLAVLRSICMRSLSCSAEGPAPAERSTRAASIRPRKLRSISSRLSLRRRVYTSFARGADIGAEDGAEPVVAAAAAAQRRSS